MNIKEPRRDTSVPASRNCCTKLKEYFNVVIRGVFPLLSSAFTFAPFLSRASKKYLRWIWCMACNGVFKNELYSQ